MLKITIPKVFLIIVISAFCLHLSGVAAERECWDCEGGGPTVSGNYTYPPFQYDPDNPDEIDRNNSIPICVIGGIPPYTWQVSGNGFSLSEGATKGLTNTLIANDTACGTATITVTDTYGVPVTGYVRCTTGQWSPAWPGVSVDSKEKGDYCTNPNCKTSTGSYTKYGAVGKYYYRYYSSRSSSYWHCQPGCEPICSECGPDGDGKTGVCHMTLSDGNLTLEITDGICGFCYATLYRQEWVCP
jgi:hypothetical protein